MSEITWDDLTQLEQEAMSGGFPVKREFVPDYWRSLESKGLVEIIRIDHRFCQINITDKGRDMWAQMPTQDDDSALVTSQQPDGGADVPPSGEDEPTYNASTNWINKPKAQAREEMEAGWQAVEIERLQAEVEQQQEVVPKLLYALGVDPSDWVASDSGIKAAIDSNLKVASGEITDREEWGDVPEDTITEAIFKLRDRVDGLQAANVELTTRNRALLNAVAFAVDALDGLGPLDALTRLYALKRKVDALK